MKWNLDLLEEVKNQHDEALISTEHVVNRVRSDLFSMTEEVWEGEDADIARDQLHELSFKEMPDTYDQIDNCNNVIQKAQKEAYESKNFCNDFPQIFRNGSMPSDGNQSRCTGDLMCDEDSCEGLKSSMKAAGENARNVHSAISSVESILASLETDFAKFDYSSYTQPIKEQTQKVAERTEMYNTAVTRYEHKTKELDHTLSNALKLATPDFVPAPLDPSCLGIGDELHFGDSKITGSLEEYITAKIDGELDEAQIKDILSMLFDKEHVDISEYSEEDFGMAFIKLSEEKKRAMLMEMGYSKEQIDSILDSCKGNKAVTVGNSIGRTLIEKIADKDGNKHGRCKTGKASTLGLAGIKGPGQFNTDFAKTDAVATDATTAGSGSSSKDKQKPKQKPKNNANNTTSNSGSNGNNTATASSDPHAEYKTGDPEVDKEIDRLFKDYGEDLSGLPEDFIIWDSDRVDENWSDETKKALASIYEKCMEKINDSFDNSECEKERAIAGNILHTTVDYTDEYYPYVFNQDKLSDFEDYLGKDSAGYDVVQKLKEAKREGLDIDVSLNYIDILIEDEGISFRFRDFDDKNKKVEFMSYTSDDRDINYIEWCKDHNRLELYNYDENKYEFELIVEKYKFEGYKLSEEEKQLITELFEKYYGIYDDSKIPSEKEIEIQEKLLKTCIKAVENPADSTNYKYEVDKEYIEDIMNRISDYNSMAYVVLANFSNYDFYSLVGLSSKKASYNSISFNIRPTDAGIITEYEIDTMENDHLGPDAVTNPGLDNKTGEVSYSISYYTGQNYIEKLEDSNSKVFGYEYSLLPDDCDKKASIASMYMTVTNTADFELMDRLMKADSTYDGVFVGNPDKISSSVAMALGKYGADLLLCVDEKGGNYKEYYNAFLSKIATPEGDITKNPTAIKDNGYIEKYSVGCSMYTEACLTKVWQLTSIDKTRLYQLGSYIDYDEAIKMLNAEEEKIFKQLDYAKDNELISFSLYCYASESEDDTVGAEVKLADNGYGIRELHITDINLINNSANTYTKKSDAIKEIDMYSYSELEASDAKKNIIAKKLEEEINAARKDIYIGVAISLVGIWNPSLGALFGGVEALSNSGSDGSNFIYQVAQATGAKSLQGAATLYSALSAYQSNARIADVSHEYIEENPLLSVFYTTHFFDSNSENNDNYYSRIDDVGVIRLIQDWSRHGIGIVYDANDGENKAFLEQLEDDEKVLLQKIADNMGTKYTELEIERAWNTIIYGNEAKTNTYSSIMDIPPELLIECVKEINGCTDKKVNTVQNEVNEKRSDHV